MNKDSQSAPGGAEVTQHTPGPWIYYEQEEGLWTVRSNAKGHRVAKNLLVGDARLIAASPDLLEAIGPLVDIAEEFVKFLRSTGGPAQGDYVLGKVSSVRAAIAKATEEVQK